MWGAALQVVLLLDSELTGLPLEALPVLQTSCACVSRATSLHTLRKAMRLPPAAELELVQQAAGAGQETAAAAAAASAAAAAAAVAFSPPPTFDLAHMTYIVDARCEGSTAEQASGACGAREGDDCERASDL